MEKLLTEREVLEMLRDRLGAGEQKAFAERVGITPQHLSDVLAGRRSPAGKLVEFLGVEDVGKRYRIKRKK